MLISIVTVVRNGEKDIEKCLSSIKEIKQNINDIEHIVVDGNSTDRTIDICSNYDLKILNQTGRGIYNAMNQGITHVNGKYVIFANADDYLDVKGFLSAVEILRQDDDIDAHCFSVRHINDSDLFYIWDSTKTYSRKYAMPVPHPGMFVKTALMKDKLKFSEIYQSSSDYLMTLTLFEKYSVACYSTIISNFKVGGESSNIKPLFENVRIRSSVGISYYNQVYGFFYDFYQYLLCRFKK